MMPQECFHQCCEQSAAEARPLSLQAAQEGLQLVVEGKETLECARVMIVIIRSVEECALLLALVYATAIALCRLGRCAPQAVRRIDVQMEGCEKRRAHHCIRIGARGSARGRICRPLARFFLTAAANDNSNVDVTACGGGNAIAAGGGCAGSRGAPR